MGPDWVHVTSGAQITEALGLADIGVPSLDRLLLAPDAARYLRVEEEDAPELPSGTAGYFVPGTRFFFNVTACKELKGDVVVALSAFLVTHSAPVAATAAALRKLNDNLDLLSHEEMAMVRAIMRACPGNPYEAPVSEEAIRHRFRGDPEAVADLLDALQDKGVISGRRGDRVQLVY